MAWWGLSQVAEGVSSPPAGPTFLPSILVLTHTPQLNHLASGTFHSPICTVRTLPGEFEACVAVFACRAR